MRIEIQTKMDQAIVSRIIYDDIYGASEFFLPKIWLKTWSKERIFILKTVLGSKVELSELDLRKINLKMTLYDVGSHKNSLYKRFMTVNTPQRAIDRIPLLSISKKLNKIWRGSVNVEQEYEQRWENGYRGWCPES